MAEPFKRSWSGTGRAARRVGLAAALLSCGGGTQDTLRLSALAGPNKAPSVAAASAPPRVSMPAERDQPAVRPDDALAEQLGGEHAIRAGLEERFPLHGVAVHMLAQVFAEPRFDAEVLGYLRRGARVRAAKETTVASGCPRRFHELSTGGFVCDGQGFLFGSQGPQRFEPSPPPPALHDALPYRYAKASAATLQFWRLPTAIEERDAHARVSASPELAALAARTPDATTALELPDFLRMAMESGFYVSVDREERVASDASPLPLLDPALDAPATLADGTVGDARAFVRTVRGAYVPRAPLQDVTPPRGIGITLGDALELPIGIVHRGAAKVWEPDPLGAAPRSIEALPRLSVVPLVASPPHGLDPGRVLTRSGQLVARSSLRVATAVVRPPLVPRRARLIHVRLAEQTLVAYEGERPVFATLVSTGKAGFETPTGVFRIYAKHVSTTMDGVAPRNPVPAAGGGVATTSPVVPVKPSPQSGAAEEDEAYSIEDVPWTMYFSGNYALHAAFWHDRFGSVRSHGCVNLPPADARWLFRWATPVLPAEWHGVQATRDDPGTFVYIE